MTKMLKIELYVIPMNDMRCVDNDSIINHIKSGMVDDIHLHIGDVEETDIGEFNDDHKLNKKCEIYAYRKYFAKPDLIIRHVGLLGGRLKQQALDAGLKENDIVLVRTTIPEGDCKLPVFELEKIEGSPVEWLQHRFLDNPNEE